MENRNKILGEMVFDDTLVKFNIKAESNLDAIGQLAGLLVEQDLVKDSYIPAIKAREEIYATGLELLDMGIAIPHTDPDHVNEPAMALGILEEPVTFCGMGEPDKQIDVQIMFMLAIKEPHAQLKILQALLKVFQHEGKLTALKNCKTQKEAADMLQQLLSE